MNMKLITLLVGMLLVGLMFITGYAGGAYLALSSIEIPDIPLPEKEEPEPDHPRDFTVALTERSHLSLEDLKSVAKQLDLWKQELVDKENLLLAMDEDLLHRKAILDAERNSLDEQRQEILNLQAQVESRIDNAHKILAARTIEIQAHEAKNFEELANMFSKMKLDQVVNFIRLFPDEKVTRLLSFIPQRQLIKILEKWSTTYPDDRQRIVNVTEQMRRVVRNPLEQSPTAQIQ